MPRLNLRKLDDLFIQLRAGLQTWAETHDTQVGQTYDGLPDQVGYLKEFDDRFQDIAEPLIVLATLADAERPEGPTILPRLIQGLKEAAGRREPSGREKQLLAFLNLASKKLNGASDLFVKSADLVMECSYIEDLAYIETPHRLANFLKHFDLSPKSNGSERGYDLKQEWVEEWTARYGSKEGGK